MPDAQPPKINVLVTEFVTFEVTVDPTAPGTLDAADVARVLRDIADRCEQEWSAAAVELPYAD